MEDDSFWSAKMFTSSLDFASRAHALAGEAKDGRTRPWRRLLQLPPLSATCFRMSLHTVVSTVLYLDKDLRSRSLSAGCDFL